MKPAIYPIMMDFPGRLFIMPKPSGETLKEDIEHYRDQGAELVISMLEVAEAEELSLQEEGRLCERTNLEFINFPAPDFGLPEREIFTDLVHDVTQFLLADRGVAIHCRAGIGRSGMLVCCVVAGFVGSADVAIEIVSKARGVEVPDTQEQREFIHSITQELVE